MIRLTQITSEQLEWYKEKTGGFYGMDFNFGGPSGFFGFYGEFDISSEGQVDLANLLVAHSCEHEQEEMIAEISALRQTIMDGLWSATLRQENRLEAVWEEFKLEFFSQPTRDGTVATHLLLSHDNPAIFRKPYFNDNFELRSDRARKESELQDRGGYYPVSPEQAPEQAEAVDVAELARRIKVEEGQVALVAGVSMDANNGLLDYARDNALQIAVVAPERPAFMHAQDWFVEGLAEDVLPELTRLLTT